jgi:hypothetical protein
MGLKTPYQRGVVVVRSARHIPDTARVTNRNLFCQFSPEAATLAMNNILSHKTEFWSSASISLTEFRKILPCF